MTDTETTNRWLWPARVATGLAGVSLWASFFTDKVFFETDRFNMWIAVTYVLLVALLCVRPAVKITLGIILMVCPTAIVSLTFLFLIGLALGLSEGAPRKYWWSLGLWALPGISHTTLFVVAANGYENVSSKRNAWTLIGVGVAILGILVLLLWARS